MSIRFLFLPQELFYRVAPGFYFIYALTIWKHPEATGMSCIRSWAADGQARLTQNRRSIERREEVMEGTKKEEKNKTDKWEKWRWTQMKLKLR